MLKKSGDFQHFLNGEYDVSQKTEMYIITYYYLCLGTSGMFIVFVFQVYKITEKQM